MALATVAMLGASPAFGAHCPHGEFYRVRLDVCVGLDTREARAYLHGPRGRADDRPRAMRPDADRLIAAPAPQADETPPFDMPSLDATWPNEKAPADEGLLRLGLMRAALSRD